MSNSLNQNYQGCIPELANQRGTYAVGAAPLFGAAGQKMLVFAVEATMMLVVEQKRIAAVQATLTALGFGLVSPFVPEKECC